jgi:hypothetical protein
MPHLRVPGLLVAITVGVVVLGGCGGRGVARYGFGGPATPVTTTTTETLPPTVDGIPFLTLAKDAVGEAEAYSVNKPQDVRMVLTTAATLCHLMKGMGTGCTDASEYLISLRGRFTCGMSCGQDVPANVTTTSTSPPHITTMYLAEPASHSAGILGGAFGVAGPNLSTLGHVYDLDPYVKALAGTKVPHGPPPM